MIRQAWALNTDHVGHRSQAARTATLPIAPAGRAVLEAYLLKI